MSRKNKKDSKKFGNDKSRTASSKKMMKMTILQKCCMTQKVCQALEVNREVSNLTRINTL